MICFDVLINHSFASSARDENRIFACRIRFLFRSYSEK